MKITKKKSRKQENKCSKRIMKKNDGKHDFGHSKTIPHSNEYD